MVRSSLRDELVIGSRSSDPPNEAIVVKYGPLAINSGLGVNDKGALAKAHQHPVIAIVAERPSQIDYRESWASQEAAQHIAFADGGCRLWRWSYQCRIDANLSGADIMYGYRENFDGENRRRHQHPPSLAVLRLQRRLASPGCAATTTTRAAQLGCRPGCFRHGSFVATGRVAGLLPGRPFPALPRSVPSGYFR